MSDHKREFKRRATNVPVKYKKMDSIDKTTTYYLDGIAKNYGRGGIFLATDKLMEKGTLVSLEFLLLDEGREIAIQVKAIVRWIQEFRRPKGMGMHFYDFTGLDGVDVQQCLKKLFQQGVTQPDSLHP